MTINNIAVWIEHLSDFAWVAIKQAASNRKRMVGYAAIDADTPVVQMITSYKTRRYYIWHTHR